MNAGHWNDLQLLDAIITGKTLSAAGRAIGVDQTTVARRLSAFEQRLGTRLFDRIEGRLEPTPELAVVTGKLRAITEDIAVTFATLKRTSAELRGHVRVTSLGFVLSRILAPAVSALHARHPGITLDLMADDQPLSFAKRETDIAIRFGREAEDATRIKHLGMMAFGLFRPRMPSKPDAVSVVRYAEELSHLPEMQALDALRPKSHVALRSSRIDVLIEAALALEAEIMLPQNVGLADERFEMVDTKREKVERPFYLLIHPERARIPTVASTATWIEQTIRQWNRSG